MTPDIKIFIKAVDDLLLYQDQLHEAIGKNMYHTQNSLRLMINEEKRKIRNMLKTLNDVDQPQQKLF